ncbi:MAG: hypothetical protein JW959_11885 [Pirellulales bacterium]|nr:hypothetical protein [Pirellulales bacterium]
MISNCPRCQKPVSIPPRVDSSAMVRCPLCEAEYALSESLALAPPELIPLTAATERGPTDGGENVSLQNEAALVAEQYSAAPSAGLRRRKQKSGPQMLFEVVAGGLAGCLVAYYALAFYFGPQFHRVGLPKLPLPFISWITAEPNKAREGEATSSSKKPFHAGAFATNQPFFVESWRPPFSPYS